MNLETAKGIAKLNVESIHWDMFSKKQIFSSLFQCAFLVIHGSWPAPEVINEVYESVLTTKTFRKPKKPRKKRVVANG